MSLSLLQLRGINGDYTFPGGLLLSADGHYSSDLIGNHLKTL